MLADLLGLRVRVALGRGLGVIDEDRERLRDLGRVSELVKAVKPGDALMLSDHLAGLLGNQSDGEQAARMRDLGALLVRLGEEYLDRATKLDVVVIDLDHSRDLGT